MTAEDMGKVPRRLRLGFAISSVVFVAVLSISPVKDLLSEWKQYKKDYVHLAQSRPDTKRLLADYHSDLDQIWVPDLNVVDRCVSCHQGITQPSLADPAVPQPFRAHPWIPHSVLDWGCVVCHRGQGLATESREAHEATLAWEHPLLPILYIQASCGVCHLSDLPETPKLNRGRKLLAELNCVGCHRIEGIERPAMLGPDLTNIGSKVSREWVYKWLKEPRTLTDTNGNTTVNGYEFEEEPRMPKFRLEEAELRALSGYLVTLQASAPSPYKFDPRVLAAWEKKSEAVDQGETRFREMFCTTCHSVAVTRAGETKLIGGDIGPELTKVGSKVSPDWLVTWLRDPQSVLPHALMPRYGWSDEDLYKVTRYIETNLTDPDLLSNVPRLGPPGQDEVRLGKRLFVEKGCSSCHMVAGIKPQTDFGPDLSLLGGKTISQLEFGNARIPRTLVSYIQAKISDPLSVNPAARMPQYQFKSGDLEAITTALLSETGRQSTPGLARLVIPASHAEFNPAGAFGRVYERYKCYVCHRFNGYGGDLAPDLSFEGSRAQRRWLIEFLKNPQTLRPTLTFRMPQFNMTDEEAAAAADYLGVASLSPAVDSAPSVPLRFTAEQTTLGKQLYEVKYQCQSCHTIGATGGYVGPNLSNAGNWLTPGWIEAWLTNPQSLVADTIEPCRSLTGQEIQGLTAYILTLKQSSKPATPASAGVSR